MQKSIEKVKFDIERIALSDAIQNPDASLELIANFTPEDFVNPQSRMIFQAIMVLEKTGQKVDLISVTNALDPDVSAYDLTLLCEVSDNPFNFKAHFAYLREKLSKAKIKEALKKGLESKERCRKIIEFCETEFMNIQQRSERQIKHIADVAKNALKKLDQIHNAKQEIGGQSIGFPSLDAMLNGFEKDDLIVVAGRSSMGKTKFATNIAEHIAINEGKPVIIFSIEMSYYSLFLRIAANQLGLSNYRLSKGWYSDREREQLGEFEKLLKEYKLYIDDSEQITIDQIRSKARRLKLQHDDLSLVMIDYLQILNHSYKRTYSKADAIGEITRTGKRMAKELETPVLLISQLNRECEKRNDKRPIMADLKDSGSIEQDADKILLIYRDYYYNPGADPADAEIILAKNRGGIAGKTVRLNFDGDYSRFTDPSQGKS